MLETTVLEVADMTCGSCVAAVTKALQRVPGVHDVQVDLRGGIARVTADRASQQTAAFVAALAEAGYRAGAASGTPAAQERRTDGCGHGSPAKSGGGCGCR